MSALTYDDVRAKVKQDAYEPPEDLFKTDRVAYRARSRELRAQFEQDALEACGLKGHPKAQKAFNLAYEQGHACGYNEVLIHLSDLADLLLD